jgi:hypothetical protein
MANTIPKANRKRPTTLRVSVSMAEKKALRLAALKADLPVTAYVRIMALAAMREGLPVSAEA